MDYAFLWVRGLVDAFDRRADPLWAAIPISTVEQLSVATNGTRSELENRFWELLAELDGGDA